MEQEILLILDNILSEIKNIAEVTGGTQQHIVALRDSLHQMSFNRRRKFENIVQKELAPLIIAHGNCNIAFGEKIGELQTALTILENLKPGIFTH